MRKIERLDKYMSVKGLNDDQVTVSAGLCDGLLEKTRQGKGDLSKEEIEKILDVYSDINKVWFLTGEGEMLDQDASPENYLLAGIDKSAIGKFADAIESIARSNSTMSETNKILAECNAELIDQIRKLLSTVDRPQGVNYPAAEHKPTVASDKKTAYKP